MAVLKKRPKMSIRTPRDVRTGGHLDVEVVLNAEKPVEVEWLRVTLLGTETTCYGRGGSTATYRHTLIQLCGEVMKNENLKEGSYSRTVRFPLDVALPPSTVERQLDSARVDYQLQVRASIPWWPDAKANFAVMIKQNGAQEVLETPLRVASRKSGARGDEPYLEISLDSSTYHPEDLIRGRVALFNVEANRYKALEFSLVARIERRRKTLNGTPRAKTVMRGPAWTMRVPLEDLREGGAVPFQMALPAGITPSYRSVLTGRSWALEVRAKTGPLRADGLLNVPIEITSPRLAGAARRRRMAPPSIGSDLMKEAWLRVAQELPALRVDSEGGLTGRVGEVDISVGRELRGADGVFLTAELKYSSLQLHLDGGLVSGFRRFLGGGVEIGDPSWDKQHYLTGREPAQVEAFIQAFQGALQQAELADISDEGMCFEVRDSGMRHAPVKRLAGVALEVAGRFPSARAAIPPPAALAHALPAWRRLAARLDGEVELARLAIKGRWQGQAVQVTTEHSAEGEVLHTEIALVPSLRLEVEHQLIWLDGEVAVGDLGRLTKRAHAQFAQAIKGAHALHIRSNLLTLWLLGPLANPKPIPRRFADLEKLAGALTNRAGPYR